MDIETFKKLTARLTSGNMTHLEFLQVLKNFGESFEPPDEKTMVEKEKMLSMLEAIITNARLIDIEEKEELALEAEEWLQNPRF